jgi:Mg2+ and Co2+ transporter CorA
MRGLAPQLEVMLTSATLSVALIGVVSGLFGMNLHNTHEDSYDTFVIVRPLDLPP